MLRSTIRLITGGAVLAFALVLTGCGDTKKGEPKVSEDSKQLDSKIAGGPTPVKGVSE